MSICSHQAKEGLSVHL